MRIHHPLKKLCCTLVLSFFISPVLAEEIRVAVASNFATTMKDIVTAYESQTKHTVVLIIGSTGKHYAQIKNGAPFDIFFAADERRPALLEKEGIAIPGSRFTYAQGRLVLWSPDEDLIDEKATVLTNGNFHKLAIANPKLAPYGLAAREVLQARDLWEKLRPRLVRGENIGQTFQFVRSGNVALGFVAAAQMLANNRKLSGSYWEPPQALYTPIIQQAVLLKDTPATQAFITFIKRKVSRAIIQSQGYHTQN